MGDNNVTARFEQLLKDCYTYVNLKYASIKLSLVENLSALFGSIIAILIFGVFAMLALMLFSVALVLWVATWSGSLLCASLIVGGFYLLIAIVVLMLRKKIMANSMVRMLTNMFFPQKDNSDD